MKDLSNYGKSKNAKAQQFFDDNANKKKPVSNNLFSPSEMAKFERIKNTLDIKPVKVKIPEFVEPKIPHFEPLSVNNNVRIKTIPKNPPMTAKDYAIAKYMMEKQVPWRTVF